MTFQELCDQHHIVYWYDERKQQHYLYGNPRDMGDCLRETGASMLVVDGEPVPIDSAVEQILERDFDLKISFDRIE